MLEEKTAAQRGEGSCSRWESRSAGKKTGMYRRISQQSAISAAPELVWLLTPVRVALSRCKI